MKDGHNMETCDTCRFARELGTRDQVSAVKHRIDHGLKESGIDIDSLTAPGLYHFGFDEKLGFARTLGVIWIQRTHDWVYTTVTLDDGSYYSDARRTEENPS